MGVKTQKRLAADILNVGKNKVWIDPSALDEVEDAITREDIKALIDRGIIKKKEEKGQKYSKKAKNGIGSRKGAKGARKDKKKEYVQKVRAQRNYIKELKEEDKINKETYKNLYRRISGGFFRSKRHIKVFLRKRGELNED